MNENVSKTLYEKLEEIESIKRDLRDALLEIGGKELFKVEPRFEDYPSILRITLGEIQTLCVFFENYVYGTVVDEDFKQSDITYKTLFPYIDQLDIAKTRLVNILNSKGVFVERDTPLIDIIELVNTLEPPAPVPNSDSNNEEDPNTNNEEENTEEPVNIEDPDDGE